VLAAAGKSLTPALAPMGISEDNWPATVGMLTGILAKETVVGTLNVLYGSLAEESAAEDGEVEAFDLWAGIAAAFATIPANLADLANRALDPLGLDIVHTGDLEAAAEAQEVDVGTFGAMASRFDGRIGAFAYLLAVLLYMPCVSAVAAIYRETGPRWAVFASLWTTGLGYGAAVVVYQAGTFDRDPVHATAWIAGILLLFAMTLLAFRVAGEREAAQQQPLMAAAE
jgi:ferrous iron transport protein B